MRLRASIFKTYEKKSGYDYFKSLDDIPIWNWYKLHETNDLKYLLKIPDYTKKIVVSSYFKALLKSQYQSLIYQFEKMDLTLAKLKRDYVVKLLELIQKIAKESLDYEKVGKAFTIIQGLLVSDEPQTDWLFNVNFTETPDQKSYLTEVAIAVKKYNAEVNGNKRVKKQTLYEKTVKIETILGVKIDVKTCSVLMYSEYEREAVNRIEQLSKYSDNGNR